MNAPHQSAVNIAFYPSFASTIRVFKFDYFGSIDLNLYKA